MDDALLSRLTTLLHDSGLKEIEFEEGDIHIHLVKDGGIGVKPRKPRAATVSAPPEPMRGGDHNIIAGLTGTFYRSPSPDVSPFVEIGDRIEEGQTIGLLEAMKMLSPIEADRAGIVVAIAAENGTLVTRGSLLFRLGADERS